MLKDIENKLKTAGYDLTEAEKMEAAEAIARLQAIFNYALKEGAPPTRKVGRPPKEDGVRDISNVARAVAQGLHQSSVVGSRQCLTIDEFCSAHGNIARSFFHKLVNQGEGPRLLKIGRRTMITLEAAEEWRKRNEESNG